MDVTRLVLLEIRKKLSGNPDKLNVPLFTLSLGNGPLENGPSILFRTLKYSGVICIFYAVALMSNGVAVMQLFSNTDKVHNTYLAQLKLLSQAVIGVKPDNADGLAIVNIPIIQFLGSIRRLKKVAYVNAT
ncbi:hypothetical protein LY76DRAFT_610249 [Colletotrichum caudatum]|nr:hypothetical protein LY76DRAFT_610249 [Colletotrichum caudatum]